MSGLDPAAAAALQAAVSAADGQFLETALTLGTATGVLQTQLSSGDVLAALILPPQNGQDLIEIAGQIVVAQLPPDVHPGETIALQVTGFSGNQILVRNLGVVDPENPPALAELNLEPSGQAAQQTATLISSPDGAPPTPAQPQPLAPPNALFVAASVVRTPAASAPPPNTAPPNAANAPQPIDVRIAAAQNAARVAPPPAARAAAPAASAPVRTPAPDITATLSPVTQKFSGARTVSDALRAARLPDTAFTRTVTAIAKQAPQRLASVLRRLDAALQKLPDDPRASTARTIASFVARMNLANRDTLPAQIEAFVSHVVRGAEAKLVAVLQALDEADAATLGEDDAETVRHPDVAAAPGDPATEAPAPNASAASRTQSGGVSAAPALSAAQSHARAAVFQASRDHDLKTTLLALQRDLPAGRAPSVAQALNESLVTLAGTQLHSLDANAQTPNIIAIPLPAFFHDGGKPAYLRISRDGGSSSAPMDADNFHIGFVLDTANLGTVGIDVRTAGRAVNVEVKTETAPAAVTFNESFVQLRERLESLRYRVAATSAAMLQTSAQPASATAIAQDRPSGTLDAQA